MGRRSERIKSQQSGKLCFPSCPCLKWIGPSGGCSIHHVAASRPLDSHSPLTVTFPTQIGGLPRQGTVPQVPQGLHEIGGRRQDTGDVATGWGKHMDS